MLKHAANSTAWAIGHLERNGFHVRRVVWGKTMARAERRHGEEIRAATIMIGGKTRPRAADTGDTIRRRLSDRLNDHLCQMREGYDDSVSGFNEAWDVVRKLFDDMDAEQTVDAKPTTTTTA